MPPQEKIPNIGEDADAVDKGLELVQKGYANPAFVAEDVKNDVDTKAVAKNEDDAFEFDDLLPHIGEFGIYQKILFLLMIPFAFFVAWVYFSQIFITLIPEQHWCSVPELANLTIEER